MKKSLIAYFSASGVTAAVAKHLAKAAEADLYEIRPAVPYTKADMDWRNPESRSSVEHREKAARPAIAAPCTAMDEYDTIYLGFPIWWYTAPSIVHTFLDSYDFSGKTIILFATSGGSGFGDTAKDLQESLSDRAVLLEGAVIRSDAVKEGIQNCLNAGK